MCWVSIFTEMNGLLHWNLVLIWWLLINQHPEAPPAGCRFILPWSQRLAEQPSISLVDIIVLVTEKVTNIFKVTLSPGNMCVIIGV